MTAREWIAVASAVMGSAAALRSLPSVDRWIMRKLASATPWGTPEREPDDPEEIAHRARLAEEYAAHRAELHAFDAALGKPQDGREYVLDGGVWKEVVPPELALRISEGFRLVAERMATATIRADAIRANTIRADAIRFGDVPTESAYRRGSALRCALCGGRPNRIDANGSARCELCYQREQESRD